MPSRVMTERVVHASRISGHVTAMLALSALAFAVLVGCRRGDARAAENSAGAPSQLVIGTENIVIATPGMVTNGPAIAGTLTPALEATVRALVAGSVISANADVGQPVSHGQVLGQIDASAIRDAVLSARSGVTSAQNAFDLAARDLQRNKTLLAAGAIATRDYEAAERGYTGAQAALENAKAQLASAQKNLANTHIVAPFSGIVSQKSVNPGDVVQPGTALFTMVDPSSMRLDASVSSERLGDVHIGTDVTFSVTGYPGREFHGRVARVSPAVDPATRQVGITVAVPNAGHTLVAGLYADGRLASRTQRGIVVPLSAVDVRMQRPAVVRVRDGRVERVDVMLGMRDERAETVQITSGVSAGDTLLVAAAQGITPGTPVRVEPPPSDRAVTR